MARCLPAFSTAFGLSLTAFAAEPRKPAEPIVSDRLDNGLQLVPARTINAWTVEDGTVYYVEGLSANSRTS